MLKYLLSSLLIGSALSLPQQSQCRCQPNDPCWPSLQQWSALNNSVNGNLASVRPVASVCHDPQYNEAACAAVNAASSNSTWRASQPGAVQWYNWEAWAQQNESCYIDSPTTSPCQQGRISLYSVKARSTADIQHAVRFARKHNLRVAIKNSGHDFLGRSSAPHSLQILTFWLKSITFTDDFHRDGDRKAEGLGPAVTIGAGVNLKQLYSATKEKGVTVAAGSSHTVGAAGGYIQGGGHGILGHWKGMASDNALEFKVVTAEGELVTANDCQNQDLFWALRGGGGGTFGVVVSVTLRTFPEVPVAVASINFTSTVGNPGFWNAVEQFHAFLPIVNDAGATGYYFLMPNTPVGNTSLAVMSASFFFVNQSDTAKIDEFIRPVVEKINSTSGVTAMYESLQSPNVSTIFDFLVAGNDDVTGGNVAVGSRLISKDFLSTPDGPKKLAAALQTLSSGPNHGFTGHIVTGGATTTNGQTIDSALNPAWRKTVLHIAFGRGWPNNATLAEQDLIRTKLTEVEVPILKALEGGDNMGAYLNEADAYEPNFQFSFWGSNYARLYAIKQKIDPEGLFIVRCGVGSEDWDDAGLCRV